MLNGSNPDRSNLAQDVDCGNGTKSTANTTQRETGIFHALYVTSLGNNAGVYEPIVHQELVAAALPRLPCRKITPPGSSGARWRGRWR